MPPGWHAEDWTTSDEPGPLDDGVGRDLEPVLARTGKRHAIQPMQTRPEQKRRGESMARRYRVVIRTGRDEHDRVGLRLGDAEMGV